MWRRAGYLEPLSQSYTCILFDHRGHGQSDHPEGPEANHIDRYVADAITLLDALELQSVAFWGYSSSIAVGLKATGEHPDRLSCLLMSGTIGNFTGEQIAAAAPERIADHRANKWETLIAAFEDEEGPAPAWMRESIRATDIEPVIGWWKARPSWDWNPWDALVRVDAPGMFIVGEKEDPEDEMAQAAARMKLGERVRVPGKGHINAFLDSAFVLPHVCRFLERHHGVA